MLFGQQGTALSPYSIKPKSCKAELGEPVPSKDRCLGGAWQKELLVTGGASEVSELVVKEA